MTYADAVSAVSKSNGMLRAWRPSASTQFVAPPPTKGLVNASGGALYLSTSDTSATDWQLVSHGSYTPPA
jgi:hypothetical protein